MFFEIFIQMMPYLAVFAVLGYIGRAQQKKAKEREEEQKKGIIRTCYVVKTEKILTIIFIIGIFFTGGLVVASVIQPSFCVWYCICCFFNRIIEYDNVET